MCALTAETFTVETTTDRGFTILASTKKALDPRFLHEVLRVLDVDH